MRQIVAYLRYVGKVQLICSEMKNRPDGRRKYLACNDLKISVRVILLGYKLRWRIEIFHKEVKSYLGFQDVATRSFKSVKSHVYWVYCAYILLNSNPPGIPNKSNSIIEKQRQLEKIVETKEVSRVRQLLTQINGVEKLKNEFTQKLEALQAG